jgi:hypothetical protein
VIGIVELERLDRSNLVERVDHEGPPRGSTTRALPR